MNDYLISILLGIVEGATEFLPVSSTAHIRLTQAAVDIDLKSGYWKMYAVVIQLGAILSVLVYFRRRIIDFLKTFPRGAGGDRTAANHPLTLVLIAFVVTAVPAFLLSKAIKGNLESTAIMGTALIVGGIVMWVVDVLVRRVRTVDMEQMTVAQAFGIGLAQVLSAVFPGTSRSMVTIATGQLLGMSRPAALEFSFFLSIPIMFAACAYDLLKSLQARPGDPAYIAEAMDAHRWGVLAIGFVVSFIVALAVIAWFMGWVRRHGFVPFAIYRIVAGTVVLALHARGLM
jgi:undecaprenyl-diphosphatase